MTFFAVEQVRRVRDLDGGRAGWVVALPDLSFDGRVIAPGHADEAWVVERLDAACVKLGYNVVCGRLWSPTELTE